MDNHFVALEATDRTKWLSIVVVESQLEGPVQAIYQETWWQNHESDHGVIASS